MRISSLGKSGCFARAKTTKDAEAKAYWLALAEVWQSLAEHVERSDARNARNMVSDRAA